LATGPYNCSFIIEQTMEIVKKNFRIISIFLL